MYLKQIGCETVDRIQLDHTKQQETAQEGRSAESFKYYMYLWDTISLTILVLQLKR